MQSHSKPAASAERPVSPADGQRVWEKVLLQNSYVRDLEQQIKYLERRNNETNAQYVELCKTMGISDKETKQSSVAEPEPHQSYISRSVSLQALPDLAKIQEDGSSLQPKYRDILQSSRWVAQSRVVDQSASPGFTRPEFATRPRVTPTVEAARETTDSQTQTPTMFQGMPEVSTRNFQRLMTEYTKMKEALIKLEASSGIDMAQYLTVEEYESRIRGLQSDLEYAREKLAHAENLKEFVLRPVEHDVSDRRDLVTRNGLMEEILRVTRRDLKQVITAMNVKKVDQNMTSLLQDMLERLMFADVDGDKDSNKSSDDSGGISKLESTTVEHEKILKEVIEHRDHLQYQLNYFQSDFRVVEKEKQQLQLRNQQLEQQLASYPPRPQPGPPAVLPSIGVQSSLQSDPGYQSTTLPSADPGYQSTTLPSAATLPSAESISSTRSRDDQPSSDPRYASSASELRSASLRSSAKAEQTEDSGFMSGGNPPPPIEELECERCEMTFKSFERADYEEHIKKCVD